MRFPRYWRRWLILRVLGCSYGTITLPITRDEQVLTRLPWSGIRPSSHPVDVSSQNPVPMPRPRLILFVNVPPDQTVCLRSWCATWCQRIPQRVWRAWCPWCPVAGRNRTRPARTCPDRLRAYVAGPGDVLAGPGAPGAILVPHVPTDACSGRIPCGNRTPGAWCDPGRFGLVPARRPVPDRIPLIGCQRTYI